MQPELRLGKKDYAGFRLIAAMFSAATEQAMRELLQEKHLYQSATVTWPNMNAVLDFVKARNQRFEGDHEYWSHLREVATKIEWRVVSENEWSYPDMQGPGGAWVPLLVSGPTIKVYCQGCDEVNPFHFIDAVDLVQQYPKRDVERIARIPDAEQVLALQYGCQGCKSHREVFLIERNGPKVKLSGRAPMEKVVAPRFIPKRSREHYSQAVIAYNSGQVLPAKFLLRTLVEQYVRLRAGSTLRNTEDVESLFQAYAASLPESFKQEFPSLYTIYSRLSAELHCADDTEEGYLQAKENIEQHFDAKRVYRLPD